MNVPAAARVCLPAIVAAAVATASLSSQPQNAPRPAASPSGAITGVVVSAQSGEPIPGALVYLAHNGRGTVGRQSRQLTDTLGRFAFTDLAPSADYTVSTMAAGYFNGGFSQEREFGSRNVTLALAGGQWIQDVKVSMWRGAVISGRVIDEAGEPVVDAAVHVLREVTIAGSPHLASGPIVRTDDRGAYRIANLPPGRDKVFVVTPHRSLSGSQPMLSSGAKPAEIRDSGNQLILARGAVPPPAQDARRQSYGLAFHGGSTADDATVVELGYGDDRTGIDIQLSPVPVVSVAGTIDGPAEVRSGLEVRLIAKGLDDLPPGAEVATARARPDGSFVFLDVPAGTYIIDASTMTGGYSSGLPPFDDRELNIGVVARSGSAIPRGIMMVSSSFPGAGPSLPPSERRAFSGQSAVTVGASDLNGIVVPLTRAASIAGRLVVDADVPPTTARPEFMTVVAEPADGRAALAAPQNQLTRSSADEFLVGGLLRGAYVLHGVVAPGWTVKSIAYDGRDYVSAPFDESSGADRTGVVVTFTTRAAVVTGRVHDDSGRTTGDAAVIAFPVEHDQWHEYGLEPARIQSAPTAPDGTFRITALPAGAYNLVAVSGADEDAWHVPDFFAKVESRATRVDVTWGDHKSIDVGVIR